MNNQIIVFLLFATLGFISCKVNQPQEGRTEHAGETLSFEVNENSFMMKMQASALQEPFRGIFTSEGKVDSLFPIQSTGVSTEPIVQAAEAFLGSLSPPQLEHVLFDVQDDEWRKWSNVDNGIFRRAGLSLKAMNANQRSLALSLMRKALSAKGLQLAQDIMKTDQSLRELNNNDPWFDEELYYITVMGRPSMSEPWGWQIDGHHLIINYFILRDQVVMTPTFMGAEPVVATEGKYKGNTLFQDEQNLGLAFMQSLSKAQQETATIDTEKRQNNAKTEAFRDNVRMDFEGLQGSEMSKQQKQALLALADQYISNMREGHREIKMSEVKHYIDQTYFAWVGTTAKDAVFYYRIHSPVVLIEFDHQGPIGVRGNSRKPTRNHIHTVVRTPNGNDYGKDLLRQHLENHH
ncbi:MAG: DUF3500 domain-containing protein [Bacteroidota bacterium]